MRSVHLAVRRPAVYSVQLTVRQCSSGFTRFGRAKTPIVVAVAFASDYSAWMACLTCHGDLWLCELHQDRSWPHCAAVGIPCLCNPYSVMHADFMSVAESETYRRVLHAHSSEKPH